MSLGGWLSIAPMATISFFGTKNYSRNYGLLFTAYGVGALGGSLVSGSIKDIFKNYINFFYPVIGLALIGILLSVLFLRTQNKNN
jgi:MFS family permease